MRFLYSALLSAFLLFSSTGFSQPTYSSYYLDNPELFIDFVVDCATFWKGVEDELHGGFHTHVGKSGNLLNNSRKSMVSHSRDAFGFAKAFMLTGDEQYLDMARTALDYMYLYHWDEVHDGWVNSTARGGSQPSTGDKTAFDQHYALLGISAMAEATGDSMDWEMLDLGYQYIEDHLWDDDTTVFGYFHKTNREGTASEDKSFNATVDAVTTHLYSLYLLTGDQKYYDRLMQMKRNMIDRLVASMEDQVIGFAEHYHSDWSIDESDTRTIMGHVLKTGWCLARIYRLLPEEETLDASKNLIQDVLDNGYDHEFGGPYKDYTRTTGNMLMYGAYDIAKAWWQMEQAVTAGFLLFEITWEEEYLRMAEESIDFYLNYFVDPVYGEVYGDRSREGGRVQYSGGYWDENKGSDWKAAYHSIETGYFSYIYCKLLLKQEPVTLYYKYNNEEHDRTMHYNPIAVDFSKLVIASVDFNGSPYARFDSTDRLITIPADTAGVFAVTYEMNGLDAVIPMITAVKDKVNLPVRIYPNPAFDMVNVRFKNGSGHRMTVDLFDYSGRMIRSMETSQGQIELDVSELISGIYLLNFTSEEGVASEMLVVE